MNITVNLKAIQVLGHLTTGSVKRDGVNNFLISKARKTLG